MHPHRLPRLLAGVAVAALALTACGTDDATVADPTDDATATDMDDASMDDGTMGEESMGEMDMGSEDGPRADEVESTELRSSDFMVLDGAPAAFAEGSGTAYLALEPGTVLTVDVEGLEPGTEVVGHLHAETCETSGGPHFKFDPDGEDVPPNEVHLSGTAGDDGAFTVTVTNEMVAAGAQSVVLHATDGDTTKALCANLAD